MKFELTMLVRPVDVLVLKPMVPENEPLAPMVPLKVLG